MNRPTTAPEDRRRLAGPAVWGVVVVVALFAAAASGAPTGIGSLDAVYRVAFAIAVVVGAAYVSPTVLLLAGVVLYGVVAAVEPSVAIVVIALVASVAALWPSPVARGVAGGILAVIALSLPRFGFHGAPSLVVAVTAGSVIVSGAVTSGVLSRHRRAVVWSAAVSAVVVGVLAATAAASAFVARSDLEDAVANSRAGLEALRGGDVERGVDLLERAARDFARGGERADNVVARAARVLPVVAQQQRMLADAGEAGNLLATVAAREAAGVDVDRISVVDGAFDLAVLDDLGAAIERSLASVVDAQRIVVAADSDWLLPPLSGRVSDLLDELADARSDLELSRDVVDAAPWILGEGEARRYFVVLASPAESRELGGFMGAYATLVVQGGAIRLEANGASRDLNRTSEAAGVELVLHDADSYPFRYRQYDVGEFWQNLTGTPDLPTVARAAADLYPQVPDGEPVDGVIYLDPYALSALVGLSGPLRIEGREEPLRPEETAEYMLRGQYLEFPDVGERDDVLDAILDASVAQLLAGSLPEPREVFDALQPQVRRDRLRMHVFDGPTQELFDDIGLGSALEVPDGDYFALRQANRGINKLDAYLERRVDLDVVVDPTSGAVRTVMTAELTSTVPAGDLPDYVDGNIRDLPEGTNQALLSIYSVAPVEDVFVDGVRVSFEPLVEYGLRRATFVVDIPPGATVVVEARISGFVDPGPVYDLQVDHQPLSVDDEMTVVVRDARSITVSGPTAEPDVDRASFVLDRVAHVVAELGG